MIPLLRMALAWTSLPTLGPRLGSESNSSPPAGMRVNFRGTAAESPTPTVPTPEPLSGPPASPDGSLLQALKRGDETAFRDLYRKHHAPMTRLARLYVRSQASAEEAAQEAWMGVIRGLERFEGRSSLKTWMYRILVNQAKRLALKEGKTLPFSALGSESLEGDSGLSLDHFDATGHWKSTPRRWEHDSPERLAEAAETRAFILDALETLPAKEQAVVRLRELQLWSSSEVCKVLEISEVYQRVLLHRGRTKLRLALQGHFEEGLPC